MAAITIHHPLAPIVGKNGMGGKWDNTVKTSKLSPEELEKYRNGEKGGRKMVTYEDYKKKKEQGMSDKEIAKEFGFSIATLYNRLKVWKGEPLKSPGKSREVLENMTTVKVPAKDSSEQLKDIKEEFKHDLQGVLKDKDEQIAELRKDRDFWKENALKWEETAAAVETTDETFNEAMAANDRLRRENNELQDRLDSAEQLREQSRRMYSELLNNFTAMKEEFDLVRKLAYLKLKKDVQA
ncbi:hypothetical protein BN1002_02985 [Bacillus sp. B-jedd]|nr:hypothetical protein BN1002_02985 [Bacillus sp. B-jedd]